MRTLVADYCSAVPPHQFGVEGRPGQPQRLRNADFVLQPRRCLSLADKYTGPVSPPPNLDPLRARHHLTNLRPEVSGLTQCVPTRRRRKLGVAASPVARRLFISPSSSLAKMSNTKGGGLLSVPSSRVTPDQQDLWAALGGTSCLFVLSSVAQPHISAILVKMSGGRRLLNGFDDRLQNFWRRLANCPKNGAILERRFSRKRCCH
jgi:hypothetical protein